MKGLKIIASVLLLAVICTASESVEEIMAKILKYDHKCRKEFGLPIDEDEVKKLCLVADIDRNTSCYMACIFKKMDTMKDGEILLDRIKESVSPFVTESSKNELLGKLETCKVKTSTASDDCDKIIGFARCMINESEICKLFFEK